jgi:hypothetical protein
MGWTAMGRNGLYGNIRGEGNDVVPEIPDRHERSFHLIPGFTTGGGEGKTSSSH